MYDVAVKYLAKDTQEHLAKAEELEKRLQQLEDGKEKRRTVKDIEGLRVRAYVSDPETRWKFANGLGAFSIKASGSSMD